MGRTFQIVKGADGLESIRHAWKKLTAQNPRSRYFHTYSWHRAYLECLETNPDAMVFTLVYQGDLLEAIFPVRIVKKRPLGLPLRLLLVPSYPHMNLQDVVLSPRANNRGLLAELLQFLNGQRDYRCDAIQFGEVLEDSATLQLLECDESLRITAFPTVSCDYLPAFSEENLSNAVSRNLRGNLRKARRKLAKRSNVEFLSARDPAVLRQYFPQFLEIEASGWKGANGTQCAIKLHAPLGAFYGKLAEHFGAEEHCEINLLKVDDQIIAGQFTLIVGDTMYLLKIGYDEEYAELTPGNLLLARTLDRLSAEDDIRYLNLITDAVWHRRWRPSQTRVFECCLYGSSLMARLLYCYAHIRRSVGRLRRTAKLRLPGSLIRQPNNRKTPSAVTTYGLK